MNKNSFKCWIDQRESFGLKCAKCNCPIDKPMVSQECLHRFCTFCAQSASCCPTCGISTQFRVDLNFALIVANVKLHGKNFLKRRIVDVLYADGVNLSTFDNARHSRMGTTQEKERERTPHPDGNGLCHDAEPSTSSTQFSEHLNDSAYVKNSTNFSNMNGVVNYISGQPTFCCSPAPPLLSVKSAEPEIDVLNKSGNAPMGNRRSLFRNIVGYEPIVLWPDGGNFKLDDLPKCLLRPRYLLIPPEATVAHLVGYLFKRAEMEAAWKHVKYRVELMSVDDEREELRLWMDPMRNIEYLIRDFKNNLQDNSEDRAYMLVVRKTQNDLNFNTNLIMAHPFKALLEQQLLAELIREHKNSNRMERRKRNIAQQQEQVDRRRHGRTQSQYAIRPLKIVFRFVSNTM